MRNKTNRKQKYHFFLNENVFCDGVESFQGTFDKLCVFLITKWWVSLSHALYFLFIKPQVLILLLSWKQWMILISLLERFFLFPCDSNTCFFASIFLNEDILLPRVPPDFDVGSGAICSSFSLCQPSAYSLSISQQITRAP